MQGQHFQNTWHVYSIYLGEVFERYRIKIVQTKQWSKREATFLTGHITHIYKLCYTDVI